MIQYSASLEKITEVSEELFEACVAALRYDEAIRACANDPDKMNTYCTASGKNLDALYEDWITKSRNAIKKATS